MARITKTQLARRFKQLADELGWNTKGGAYELHNEKYRANIGYTFLQHNTLYGWSIAQIVTSGGAESRIKESCSAAEMHAWLSGALFASDLLVFKQEKTAQARQDAIDNGQFGVGA